MSAVKHTTDTEFAKTVLMSDKPVLVDFWAEWCGPCLAMGPVLDQVADESVGKLDVVKLDVDHNPQVASEYRITSIPALKVFKNGEVVKELIGSRPKAVLVRELQEYLQ